MAIQPGPITEEAFLLANENSPVLDYFEPGFRLINGTLLNSLFSILIFLAGQSYREVTDDIVNITDSDQIIVLNKSVAAPTVVNMLPIQKATRSITIIDWKGNAGDITVNADGGDEIEGLSSWTITSYGGAGAGAVVSFIPFYQLGWIVS